jgi:hypothetical protein
MIAAIPATVEMIDRDDSQFGIKRVEISVRWLHECFQLQSMIQVERLCRPEGQSGMAVDYEEAHL